MARKVFVSSGHGGNYYIYTLSSSENPDIVKYVGITNNLKRRYNKHIHSYKHSNRKVTSWIKSITVKNHNLVMTEIDTALNLEEANIKEVGYIKLYKAIGCNLKNLTLGGDGLNGYSHKEESRLKISLNNRRNTLGRRKYNLKDSDVKDLFLKGFNNREISELLKVPQTAIKESRKRLNLVYSEKKTKNINKLIISKEELIDLYLLKNLKKKEIALLYNCSDRTIKKYLSLYKIYKNEKNLY